MYILGVNISHEPSACLLKDGEIVYFSEDDRLTGVKMPEGDFNELFDLYDENGGYTDIYHHTDTIKKYTTWIVGFVFTYVGFVMIPGSGPARLDLEKSFLLPVSKENLDFRGQTRKFKFLSDFCRTNFCQP